MATNLGGVEEAVKRIMRGDLEEPPTPMTPSTRPLHHLNKEPFKWFEKIDQEPPDGRSRLIEYEVTR